MRQHINIRKSVSQVISLLVINFFIVSIIFGEPNLSGELDFVVLTLPSGKSFVQIDDSLIPLPEGKKDEVTSLIKKLNSEEKIRKIVQSSLLFSLPIASFMLPKELKKHFPDHWLIDYRSHNKLKYILVSCFVTVSVPVFVDFVFWYRMENIKRRIRQTIKKKLN